MTSGRVVGYDEKGNPITEDWLKSQIQPSKLEQQKVDSVEASKSMSELIGKVTGSERINKEFFAYLDGKYSGVVRAPDGMDIYQNPQNYSAEQKVARYIDLLKVKSQFEAYRDARQQENTGNSKTILNEPEVLKDIQQGMETLLEDPAVSGLLASEYLQGTREILEGKRFQDDEAQYDQAYTDAVEKLRTDINAQFKADILDGGIFNGGAARGANELSILTNYNSALKAFGSVLGAAEIEQHQDVINNSYNEFYTSKIEPLLPDSSSSYTSMLLASIQNLNVPEALKLNMGMMTPIIDGKTHVDLGLDLKTSGLADKLAGIKMNPETLAELRALGVSANLAQDGLTATFLPSVIQMANSVFGAGEAEKTKRAQFTETVLQELRPLIGRLDTGMTAMDLNGALERVRLSLKMRNNPMAAYANEVTTALNGLVRGANLTGNHLMMGTYGAGTGYDLAKTQALMSLGVGYEGRGLSAGNDPQGSLRDTGTDNSALARKIFGTEGRQWEAGLIKRYGIATLEPLSSKMADDIQAILPNSTVQKPIIDGVAHGRKAIDNIVETYATAVAKGLYGQDAEGVKQFSTNMVRIDVQHVGNEQAGRLDAEALRHGNAAGAIGRLYLQRVHQCRGAAEGSGENGHNVHQWNPHHSWVRHAGTGQYAGRHCQPRTHGSGNKWPPDGLCVFQDVAGLQGIQAAVGQGHSAFGRSCRRSRQGSGTRGSCQGRFHDGRSGRYRLATGRYLHLRARSEGRQARYGGENLPRHHYRH
ncbi:hypothetical protein [Rhizobium sp. Root149]|uniref:hypothetical protein n=1 Tax=Rhizobium sp. Root149 TaxID=1736473 RepID=UPI0012E33586|nr:hypothetical protein [Rhizobium sp. Root149]